MLLRAQEAAGAKKKAGAKKEGKRGEQGDEDAGDSASGSGDGEDADAEPGTSGAHTGACGPMHHAPWPGWATGHARCIMHRAAATWACACYPG